MSENFKSKLNSIRAFFFDIDGVLTNGSLLVMNDGSLLRSMNIKDGYALKKAVEKGYVVAVISGGTSEGVAIRLKNLGLQDIFMGVQDKKTVLSDMVLKHSLKKEEIAYMGDDMPDLEVISLAGVPACPADAVFQIKERCEFVSSFKGGEGCVRDLIEQVLCLHGKWD